MKPSKPSLKRKTVSYDINLVLDNTKLKLSSSVKYLGIRLDQHLSWSVHFDFLATKLRTANGVLSKLRYYIPLCTLLPIYYALFHSHLSYAAIVWGQTLNNHSRIGRLQNKAVRILTFSRYDSSAAPLYAQTGIPAIPNYIFYLNVKTVHETLNNIVPLALQNLFHFQQLSHQHFTRNNELKLLERPKAKTLKYGLKSIRYQAILNWNQLLLHSKQDLTVICKNNIKNLVKDFFVSQNWHLFTFSFRSNLHFLRALFVCLFVCFYLLFLLVSDFHVCMNSYCFFRFFLHFCGWHSIFVVLLFSK